MTNKKRIISILFLVCSLMIVLCACDKDDVEDKVVTVNPGESSLHILEDGAVVQKIVEEFDESKYNKDDFERDLKEELSEFNGSDSLVSIERLELNDSNMTLEFKFQSVQAFIDYTMKYVTNGSEVILFHGTVDEAVTAGFELPGTFTKADSDEYVNLDTIKSDNDIKVLITNIGCKIEVDGEFLYISEGVIISGYAAVTQADTTNFIFYKKVEEEK